MENQRRGFLKKSGILLSAAAILPLASFTEGQKPKNGPIGLNLFTLPKSLDTDFRGTMELIAKVGYREVEFFGPYDFGTEKSKQAWKATSGFLGFGGSGYFGNSPKEVKMILDDLGLSAPSIHIDLDSLQQNMGEVAEAAHQVGHQYVGIAMLPNELRTDMDAYRKAIDVLNIVGESAKKHGLTFFYHNHGYGHQELEGQIPLQMILDQTDADMVKMQMDIFWFSAAGSDPIAYLEANPGRFELMHIKDMREIRTFSGDGSSMQEWMGMFQYLADAGQGKMDLPTIIAKAKASGTKHFQVEHDLAKDPEGSLKTNMAYLENLI
ncbi:sugar phosphate isomerase/epimerase family protein [Pararhodonellum marinum]|uniref:sugar phosphate isomerase/epimerase family protein n=1 Tax=Pararhodonellum marinum TaxID=2755358 RepID=UPI0018900B52|nr:sugar phosphate isomerase/epimerase [Pararhodonellum marinum]